jgi:hypothetical protein
MPTDPTNPKPPKPMPSAAEINAYLEKSAARTRMRLPLAKGAALLVGSAATAPSVAHALPNEKALPPENTASRALPLRGVKKLRTQPSSGSSATRPPKGPPAASTPTPNADAPAEDDDAWRPFSPDDDR